MLLIRYHSGTNIDLLFLSIKHYSRFGILLKIFIDKMNNHQELLLNLFNRFKYEDVINIIITETPSYDHYFITEYDFILMYQFKNNQMILSYDNILNIEELKRAGIIGRLYLNSNYQDHEQYTIFENNNFIQYRDYTHKNYKNGLFIDLFNIPSLDEIEYQKFINTLSNYNDKYVCLTMIRAESITDPYYNDILYSEELFNVKHYKLLNEDLDQLSLSDIELRRHYIMHGKEEGRLYKLDLPDNFNVNHYKILNHDLFSFSDNEAIRHYINHGSTEKRAYNLDLPFGNLTEFEVIDLDVAINYDSDDDYSMNKNYLNKKYDNFPSSLQLVTLNSNTDVKPKIAILFHIISSKIFNEIIDQYDLLTNDNHILILSYNSENEELKDDILSKLKEYPNLHFYINPITDKGCYIGANLMNIHYLISLNIDNDFDIVIMINTIMDSRVRTKVCDILLNKNTVNLIMEHNFDYPVIYSSYDSIYYNKQQNFSWIMEFIERSNIDKTAVNIDKYEYVYSTETKEILDLNPDFYTYFESDLSSLTSEKAIKHFETIGKYEENIIPNPNYIIKHGKISYYVKGSCFICNKEYINIFKNSINIIDEFNNLETGPVIDNYKRATYMWEKMFGLLAYMYEGKIYGIYDNSLYDKTLNENPYQKNQSIINIDLSISKIAFLVTNKTLEIALNQIKYLQNNGMYIDIYFGHNIKSVYSYYGYAMIKDSINSFVEKVLSYGIVDLSKLNYYLGFKLQKKYDYLIVLENNLFDVIKINQNSIGKAMYLR
jgi:hypothetical protein